MGNELVEMMAALADKSESVIIVVVVFYFIRKIKLEMGTIVKQILKDGISVKIVA